jgi:hypothetical protein
MHYQHPTDPEIPGLSPGPSGERSHDHGAFPPVAFAILTMSSRDKETSVDRNDIAIMIGLVTLVITVVLAVAGIVIAVILSLSAG